MLGCAFVNALCKTRSNILHQQKASYLIPPFPPTLKKRLDRHRSGIYQTNPDDIYENQEAVKERVDKEKREKWATFGSLSNVDTASLFPTSKQIEEEKEAEERWWPTLQKMQAEIAEENRIELKKNQEREQKIAENMAKMPEWIAKFEAEQREIALKQLEEEEQKAINLEIAQEKFGFPIPSGHPFLQQYFAEMKDKKKKQKRLEAKLKKKGVL